LDAVSYNLSIDNYFDLFDFTNATVSGTFTSIVPAIPREGFKWDLSKLYTQGRIYVRDKDYVALPSVSLSEAKVYPTITTDNLMVVLPSSATGLTAVLYTSSGNQLSTILLDKDASIDVSTFPSGLYFLKLTDQEGNSTVKPFLKK
jgi:hypothetical protein